MKTAKNILKTCLPFIIAAVFIWVVLTAAGNLSRGSKAEEKQYLEDALRSAAVSCYASEGFYPPDLAYIKEHYGVQINEEDFKVFYSVFAENIMPDINVVVRNE